MDQSGFGSPHKGTHTTPGVTRNEYDALADLFLDDAAFGAGPAPAPAQKVTQTVNPHREPVAAATHLHLTNAPAVSLPSAPETSSAPNVWRLVGDGLPGDLEAAQVSHAPASSPVRLGRVIVEAIVQGHLPIFASAWVPQYARSISQESGAAVALIRVRHGQISVERFAAHATTSAALPKHATLAEAVESACAARVLVQVDEISEPDLWRTPGLDRITVLTGADEAAMVACYRTLKTIGNELAHDLSVDRVEDHATPASPALAVAVLGATAERAQQTITRIQRAASNFLSREVQGSHAAGRIGAGSSETLFRGVALDGDSSPVALIALIRASMESDASLSALRHAESHSDPAAMPSPAISRSEPPASSRPSRASAWEQVAQRLEEKLGPARLSPGLMEPKPVAHFAAPVAETSQSIPHTPADSSQPPQESVISDHPHLATFVDELLAIDDQCPYAETVEFAIAADGRLHLLAQTCNHNHTGHPGGQGRALEELTTAASWAMAHAKMLARAHAGVKLDDVEHRPILHLITDRPREARRLLDSDIRIHLVAPVDPSTRFVCRDLN